MDIQRELGREWALARPGRIGAALHTTTLPVVMGSSHLRDAAQHSSPSLLSDIVSG